MRFQDWDVLLFPNGSQTPFKEFKTACYVANDGPSMGGAVSNGVHKTVLHAETRDLLMRIGRPRPHASAHHVHTVDSARRQLLHLAPLMDSADLPCHE